METNHPKTIKLRYVGPVKNGGKVIDLPIPFIAKSEWRGQVTCNPIGEFEWADGMALLEIASEIFVKVEAEIQAQTDNTLCQCGCGKSVTKEGNRFILGHSLKFPKTPSQEAPSVAV